MDANEKARIEQDIRDALRLVIDPELGSNIVDLGLVYDVRVEEGGIAHVTMTTTTRFCPASGFLTQAVDNCAWAVPGVEYAEVHLTYDPPWTPNMMQA